MFFFFNKIGYFTKWTLSEKAAQIIFALKKSNFLFQSHVFNITL